MQDRFCQVLPKEVDYHPFIIFAPLVANSIGFEGGRTLIRSLNYWTLPRMLGLNNCMLESRARAGDCFDPLYATGK